MSYTNFIEAVEAKKLLTERDKYLCLADHCTREYEGEIEKQGDKIKVKGLGRATIYNIQADGTYAANAVGKGSIAGTGKDVIQKGIPQAEEIKGYEKEFEVNQIALFNFMVGDIDKQQSSEKGIIAKTRPKAAQDIAYEQDKHVRKVITSCKEALLTGSDFQDKGVAKAVKLSSKFSASAGYINVLDFVDEVVMQLRQNNVKDSEELFAEVSPAFIRRLKTALRNIDTNNSKLIKGREVVPYNGVNFYMANVMIEDEDYEYATVRTGDSVAFFDPLTRIKPYEPDNAFAEALKGYNLYDAGMLDAKACKYIKIDRKAYEG